MDATKVNSSELWGWAPRCSTIVMQLKSGSTLSRSAHIPQTIPPPSMLDAGREATGVKRRSCGLDTYDRVSAAS